MIEQTHKGGSESFIKGNHVCRVWFPDLCKITGNHFVGLCWVWRCDFCNLTVPYGHSDEIFSETPCMKTKSPLDGIPVKETNMESFPAKAKSESTLTVVGHCPCGAPIYGLKEVSLDIKPYVRFSCDCRGEREDLKALKGMFRTT